MCDTAGCVTAKNCTLGFLLLHCCFMVIDWEGKSCTLGFARSSDEAALLKNCCFTAASLIIRDCNFCSPCICSASCCFIAASCKSESASFPLPEYDHEAAMKQQKSESASFPPPCNGLEAAMKQQKSESAIFCPTQLDTHFPRKCFLCLPMNGCPCILPQNWSERQLSPPDGATCVIS